MQKFKILLLAASLPLLSQPTPPCAKVLPVSEKPSTPAAWKKAMLEHLDFIKSAFQTTYAPGLWKAKHIGWDLNAQIQACKDQINAANGMTIAKYRELLRAFFKSMKDYHVMVTFASTETSILPFQVKPAEGRYFITWINRKLWPEAKFPFQIGDELVTYAGESTEQAVKKLQARLGGNTFHTDHALAVDMLTKRIGATQGNVAQGKIALGIQPKNAESAVESVQEWIYTPELIPDPKFLDPAPRDSDPQNGLMLWAHHDINLAPGKENPFEMGHKTGFIPALGEKTWEAPATAHFSAYIYKDAADRSIGYVRIPVWAFGANLYDTAIKEFGELMKKFEGETAGLVIDQVNNPGGSPWYIYAIVSMLTKQPAFAPKHHIAITQQDLMEAIKVLKVGEAKTDQEAQTKLAKLKLQGVALPGKSFHGYPMDLELYKDIRKYCQFLLDQWAQGKVLTDPTPWICIDQIKPSKVANYSKPILVLINEMDISGGDFFPAIMQDNKRAKLFGTRTAGAGGATSPLSFPNFFGLINLSVTWTMAERINKDPIENLGVKPDICYEPSVEDLQNGFKEYTEEVNKAMDSMLDGDGL